MSEPTALTGGVPAAESGAGQSAGSSHDRLELQRVAQQFEGLLLTQMLREMRKSGDWAGESETDDTGLGLGLGKDTFTEAIDTELGLHLARSQSLGLTSQLLEAFDRLVADGTAAPNSAAAGSVQSLVDEQAIPVTAVVSREGPRGSADSSENPFSAVVTSAFGWRSDPLTGQPTFHRGVDLRAAYGQEVRAVAPGKVVFSGEQGGYGTTVVVEHPDGSRTRYAHLSATAVSAGMPVEAGQPLGHAGSSGRTTGPHLHFEVTGPTGDPISPGQWMQRWARTTPA